MNTEEFTVFLGSGCVAAMRTGKPERCCNHFAGAEDLTTDFALMLTVAAIVVVDAMVRRSTQRADGIFGNGFTIATLNGFDRLAVLPLIVFEKELPVLFDTGFDDREIINFKFLILR